MLITPCNNFTVYQFIWEVINSNTYVICGKESFLIVDPVDSKEFYEFIRKQGLRKALVILTHSHYDHISGLNMVKNIVSSCCVVSSKTCSENIQNPKRNLSSSANAINAFQNYMEHKASKLSLIEPWFCSFADKTFEKDENLEWESHTLQLAEYGGHTNDSVCCIMDDKYLFSGDTILPYPTITRLPGGSTTRFWKEDIPKLEKLVKQIVIVFPGHGIPGSLKEMIESNKERNMNCR